MSRLFVFALTVVAMLFVIRSLAPQTIGETARRQFLSQLQQHYRGHSISIRRGHFDPTVGFIFDDVRISDQSPATFRFRSREMVRVERMIVVTDVHPEKLLEQQNPLKTQRVILDGVQANVWLTSDGRISLTDLLPLPKLGPVAPRMEIRGIKLSLFDGDSKNRPVVAELNEAVILNSSDALGNSEKTITFRGSTDFANDVLAKIDIKDGATSLRCAVKGAYLNRDLFDRLPDAWTAAAQHAKELECVCDAELSLHQSADGQLNYQMRTTVHDGRFSHPSLPKPISQLRGIVTCNRDGVAIEALHGELGDAIVRLSGNVDRYAWPCDATFNVSTRGLLLDDRLAASLPPAMQTNWSRLQPLGRIDIDARLSHANQLWKTDATVVCKGVDVRYEKFPYPVENLVGRIKIGDGIASTESLSGRIGGNRMQCAFRLPIQPGTTNEKSFVIATDGPVPIDKTLFSSLSPRGSLESTKLETFVRSLRPRGSIQLASAMFTTDATGQQSRKIDLRVIDGYLSYKHFGYPLYNVAGKVEIENDLVTLVGLRATNANASTVLCDGTYRMPVEPAPPSDGATSPVMPHRPSESELKLNFHAMNVPMDDALRSSLPESTQQVWTAISPSGVLDELNVVLGQKGLGNPLSLDVVAKQLDHDQVTNRTLSLRPASLPYRIDIVGGVVRYDGSQVTIESISGRHEASTLSANGRCVQDQNGRWNLLLNLHSGSRLHPDGELIAALPNQMREAMRVLQLRGPISVRGQTRLAMPDSTHLEPDIQWDLLLQLEGNRIADVGPVHSLRGELSVKGVRDKLGIRAAGDVRIDSMHVQDLQITRIQGPFSIDGDILHLGGNASDRNIRPVSTGNTKRRTPSIRGKLFDGILDLDGKVVLSSGNFDVGLAVRNAQLPTVLADFGHADNELTGTFSGQTQLQGNLGDKDLLKGSGAARLSGEIFTSCR